MSITQAMDRLPLTAKDTAAAAKQRPVGSKAKRGRNSLDRMVRMGENNKTGNVFAPMKRSVRPAFSGNRRHVPRKALIEKNVTAIPGRL